MDQIVKLILPFLSTPANYSEMLKGLAAFAFYEIYFITLLLRVNQRFDASLRSIESWGPVGNAIAIVPHHDALNVSGILIAFILAVLTHAFHFHDRISDLLGIRQRFDVKSVLVPLSLAVGSPVTKDKEKKIIKQRNELMHTVF